ncbi:RidA family protein [Novosphingobium aquae]|uniref:RidA family protein n=1 Tax=Novosphingobium aquae TaxID=3133435 RepID=A0ABU8SBZ1_9SPHN
MSQPPPLSRVTIAGPTVYVSGQLARGADGKIVAGGFAAQARQALENLKSALETAGCGFSDVVKATVWLTDATDFAEFNAIYREYFAEPYPSRSVVVSGLVAPGAMVEIEAIAWRGA